MEVLFFIEKDPSYGSLKHSTLEPNNERACHPKSLTVETVNSEAEYNVAGRGKNNVPNVVFSHGISSIAVIYQLMPP
jgi:hypothetical protein